MADFNKAKIEKEAKKLEVGGLPQSLKTENKSCIRAVARYKAACSMYPEEGAPAVAESLMNLFYKGAKFQPSWEESLREEAPELLAQMKGSLGTPAPRGRRKKGETSQAVPEGAPDPDADVAPVE